jgi:hypothetical protein
VNLIFLSRPPGFAIVFVRATDVSFSRSNGGGVGGSGNSSKFFNNEICSITLLGDLLLLFPQTELLSESAFETFQVKFLAIEFRIVSCFLIC